MAREFVGNLPLDHMLPLEESKKILDEFARYLAEQGMICDVALHYKKSNINFHILCPLRKLKSNGKEFAPKRANAYVCKNSAGQVKDFLKVGDITKYNNEHNEDYKRIPLLDKKVNQKMRTRKGRKPTPEWERQPIDLTGWNDAVDKKSFFNKRKQKDTNVEKWRQKLCEIGNKYLSVQEKWEHKSYKQQGINRIPTIHEGARVQYLEQKEQQRIKEWNDANPHQKIEYQPVTTLRKQNFTIKKANILLSKLNNKINQYQTLLIKKLSSVFGTLNTMSSKKDKANYSHIEKENERRRKYLALKANEAKRTSDNKQNENIQHSNTSRKTNNDVNKTTNKRHKNKTR